MCVHDTVDDEKTQAKSVAGLLVQSKSAAAGMIDRCGLRKLREKPGESLDSLEDTEKGCTGELTRVAINITGMTCTGCSKKGVSALSHTPGVSGVQINFIASTGEFNLDSHLDPAKVISQFERETGFKCTRFSKESQSLDVLMSESEARKFEKNLPDGIESISRVGTKICSISFDPLVIGARSVFDCVPSKRLAWPQNDDSLFRSKRRLVQMAWSTGLAAMFTIPVVVMAWSKNSIPQLKRSTISLTLATCVQAIAVPEFYVGALKSLIFGRVIEMDMLVAISITAAYGYSVIAFALTNRGYILEQGEIFQTSTLLTTLILLGRLISVVARMKALTAVSMKSVQADTALLVQDSKTSVIDARLLQYDDVLIVPAHAGVVTDGEVINGTGAVNESMFTGESFPVTKKAGDRVTAGTVNEASRLTIRVTRLPGQNSITDIAGMVENALGAKPRLQDLAEKFATWFIPIVVGTSCAVFAIWVSVGLKLRNLDAGGSIGLAIGYSIAVLAVSCPCALGLAVPMVLIIAGGVAAKSGIIIKQASVTERAHRTTDVVFDKTGTLTTGELQITEETYRDRFPKSDKARSLTVALLEGNSHPVSSAVAAYLKSHQVIALCIDKTESIPGSGIQATWHGKAVKVGNPYWLNIDKHPEIVRLMERGRTVLALTIGSELIAVYGLRSKIRSEARAVIHDLHQRGISCHIVSGDGTRVVQNIAHSLGIDRRKIVSRQSPSDKQAYVKNLIEQGKIVLFCGDGTNDAVAVAQAHIGAQIGSVSDVMKATADVALTGGLESILALLDISRHAYRRIVFNFFWAGFYNVFAILLAAGAFVKARIPLAYAGLGEIVSVLPVVLVALTLMRFKRRSL